MCIYFCTSSINCYQCALLEYLLSFPVYSLNDAISFSYIAISKPFFSTFGLIVSNFSPNLSNLQNNSFECEVRTLISRKDWIEQLIVLSHYYFDISYTLLASENVQSCKSKSENYLMLSAAINLGKRNLSAIEFREGVAMKNAW